MVGIQTAIHRNHYQYRIVTMDTRSAIITFSQSEKIKAGLIWASQTIEVNMGFPEAEKRGSERIIATLLSMIVNEIHVARKMAPHDRWEEAMQHINKAVIMIHSNVAHDAPFHLSKALSQVTSIGHESMTLLSRERLL